MTGQAPETFGTYLLLERIAVGGMAEVYLARAQDTSLPPQLRGRPVVVKRMLPQLAQSAEHVTMFLDEAKLGALLKHPHIVDIFDVGQVAAAEGGAKNWYMALEYIDGPDLGQVLKTARDAKQPLPPSLAAFVVARAAEGLHFAHGVNDQNGRHLGIIHRDVSPQNILVSRNGEVKVGDFGVAKSEQQIHETQSGLVKGKIAYMSPEQISDGTLDPRTDVLALGVTLWEALTHRRMFAGLSDVEIMKRVYFDTPPLASKSVNLPVQLDDEIDAIVAKALARKRQDRFATAFDFMLALDAWASGQQPQPVPEQLALWMKARFVPRATVQEIATAWAYKSPALGSSAGGAPADDATIVDDKSFKPEGDADDDAGPDVAAEMPQTPKPTPSRQPLAKGTVLKPLRKAPQKPMPKRDLVLYVEDEQQNWEVAELLLKKNYDLIHAPDDQMACEVFRTRGKDLTAVLMDIQLKGSELDGIALVRLIRGEFLERIPSYARGITTLDIPIFFVTAYAARYSEKELLAHGADKLVTKPVDFTQMTLALTSYQLRRAARRAGD